MKNNIYDRIPMIATDDLIALQGLWTQICLSRPAPRRHDYHGKCLIRATLELESRAKNHLPTEKPIRKPRSTDA